MQEIKQEVKSVRDAEVEGKRVLLRVDFNVPMQDGQITDDVRIKAALPTINVLLKRGAKISIVTHLGRPEGRVVESLRTAPVAKRLRELVPGSDIEVLENVRFNPGEEANDLAFAEQLAHRGDIFVNDAFAVSHRAHASTVGITTFLPSYAGLLMEKEIQKLSLARAPQQGAIAIIGGAKFETKQPLIEKLLSLYGTVFLGGALGNDVLKVRGLPVGSSLVSSMPVPLHIANNEELLVPVDATVLDIGTHTKRIAFITDTRAGESIVDIGPATQEAWSDAIMRAPFVLWNGTVGMYEHGYTQGTDALAKALVNSKVAAVLGGGDTAAAVGKFPFDSAKVFISTGGGAMLQFLVEGTLPGIEALKN